MQALMRAAVLITGGWTGQQHNQLPDVPLPSRCTGAGGMQFGHLLTLDA